MLSFCLAKSHQEPFFFFLRGHHLSTFTLPFSAALLSPEGEFLHTSGASVFVVAAQGGSLIAWL